MTGGSENVHIEQRPAANEAATTENRSTLQSGSMEPFNVDTPDEWTDYLERFEFFLESNGITSPIQKRATLVTVGGHKLYKTISSLTAPVQVSKTSYDEITKLLSNFFVPRKSVWCARFNFFKRSQLPDEAANQFMAELQKLANDCQFHSLLDSMLITQFICGLRDEAVQRRLLQEKESQLTKQLAIESAVVAEGAKTEQRHMKEDAVNKVHSSFKHAASQHRSCHRCASSHAGECKYKDATCYACGKKGHLQRVCFSARNKSTQQATREKIRNRSKQVKSINRVTSDSEPTRPQFATILSDGNEIRFEVDSGSPFTIISMKTYERFFPNVVLSKKPTNITDVQGGRIVVIGEGNATIKYNGKKINNLPLLVVSCNASPILGRNWFQKLGIRIEGVHLISEIKSTVKDVVEEFADIFNTELGKYSGPPVKLELTAGARPIVLKPRSVAMALREPIEKELARLVDQDILRRVEYSEWATPIVAVKKPNGSLRICGDYKSTLNPQLRKHTHKVPSINDLLGQIGDGKIFAKLDMSQAYQQLSVDEDSAKMQAITTHKGTYVVNRLQFGIASAPGVFQSLMENILGGLQGVLPYFDDIIVIADNEKDLSSKLRNVFNVFKRNGLRLRKEKCIFKSTSVPFLGFQISPEGIRPMEGKVDAIKRAPLPTNKKELQAFLGMIGFYHPFMKGKANIAEPLHRLLDKTAEWKWTAKHIEAIERLKDTLSSEQVLAHYSLKRPVGIVADASPVGVGAVLFHTMDDGSEKPIAYYSRTITATERKYAQIDREAVAVVSAIKKFHKFLYGRSFIVMTDHKPLLGILGQKACPEVISSTMLRRRIFLSAYDYDLQYRPGNKMTNADYLSRAPITGESVKYIDHKDMTTFTSKELAKLTLQDDQLKRVLDFARNGWPDSSKKVEKEILPFFTKRNEISIEGNCLLWGTRLIIPKKARKSILEALHTTHPGIVKMKTLARQHVYWPAIDREIVEIVGRCQACQETRPNPPSRTHPWELAEKPWSRIHIDHAGPFRDKLYLIVTDTYSRWTDASIVSSTASGPTIARLRELFATHGLPDSIVSDNGSGFTSKEFSEFCKRNAIHHYRIAPYMPSSNGVAERAVQTVKNFLKKLGPNDNIKEELNCFLLVSRTTALPEGKSPSELLMGRRVETYFDKLRPRKEQSLKKGNFNVMDPVWARVFSKGKTSWGKAQIMQQTGFRVYSVEFDNGEVHKRHEFQLRSRVEESDLVDLKGARMSSTPDENVESDTESIYDDANDDIVLVEDQPEEPNTSNTSAQTDRRQRPERVRKQTSFYKAS